MSDNNSSNSGFSLLRFFSMPAVGIAGSIASIIGIVLSLYFFLAAREKAELTYFVHPAKAAVVRTGQASSFYVYYKGQNLTSDITAVQVAFWNAGSKPIHADTVLSPLVIKVGNKGGFWRLSSERRAEMSFKLRLTLLAFLPERSRLLGTFLNRMTAAWCRSFIPETKMSVFKRMQF